MTYFDRLTQLLVESIGGDLSAKERSMYLISRIGNHQEDPLIESVAITLYAGMFGLDAWNKVLAELFPAADRRKFHYITVEGSMEVLTWLVIQIQARLGLSSAEILSMLKVWMLRLEKVYELQECLDQDGIGHDDLEDTDPLA